MGDSIAAGKRETAPKGNDDMGAFGWMASEVMDSAVTMAAHQSVNVVEENEVSEP